MARASRPTDSTGKFHYPLLDSLLDHNLPLLLVLEIPAVCFLCPLEFTPRGLLRFLDEPVRADHDAPLVVESENPEPSLNEFVDVVLDLVGDFRPSRWTFLGRPLQKVCHPDGGPPPGAFHFVQGREELAFPSP